MVTNYSSAVSSIVCLDLLNLSPLDFHNLCITSPVIGRAELFLKMLYKKLHADPSNEEHAHLIYIDNNYIIGSKRHNQSHQEFQLGGFETLQENYTPIIDSNIYKTIEETMVLNKSLNLKSNLMELHQQAFIKDDEKELFSFSFINAFIKVTEGLKLTPKEINNRFFVPIHFFETVGNQNSLVLDRIYYKDQLPMLFVFTNDEGVAFMGWNERYLVFLDKVKPINEKLVDAGEMLNTILDKINLVGLSNLETKELAFLNQYSKQ
jgi:hypothetical protein